MNRPTTGHPAWCERATLYEMNVRQLTPEGTLQAAARRLSFLRAMGIDAVWLMPVQPIGERDRKGTMGSCYSVRDYCAVNPEFGTLADFDAFVAESHRLGMRVVLDWVADHTARDARWLAERPADWYERDAADEPLVPWDWSDTAKLDYANRAVWEGQFEAMRFWAESHAVDGFRCDMAMLMPPDFWHETARRLRALRPELFLLAEAEEPWLFDHGTFDACYGWELFHLLEDVARQRVRVTAVRAWLESDRTRYPQEAIRLLFTSNHDENAWNGTARARMGAAAEIMTLFTFVAPGCMPLIYTGQEVGYDHSFAFFERDPIPEALYVPDATTELYRKLCRMRRLNPALAAGDAGGSWVEIRNNAEDCLMILVRERGRNCVVAIMNLSPYTIHADYRTGIYAGPYSDALSGERVEWPGHVECDMEGWSYRVLCSGADEEDADDE